MTDYSLLDDAQPRAPWSDDEIRATVEDYFRMLRLELLGQTYNKTAHRSELLKRLDGRSGSAVEMKHQNISAALLELGVMPIRGYKPLSNYQSRLFEIVAECVGADRALDEAALRAVEQPAELAQGLVLAELVVPAPAVAATGVREARLPWHQKVAVHRDYLQREAKNRALGAAGEELVMQFEAHRLHAEGESRLADRIEQVSRSRGDGCGFDILSFDASGRERFIEVKTTAFTAETPFFLSRNEVDFSADSSDQFWLYRVFRFRDDPKLFQLRGSVQSSCRLDATSFRAVPR